MLTCQKCAVFVKIVYKSPDPAPGFTSQQQPSSTQTILRSIDSYVPSFRRLIGLDNINPLLETVRKLPSEQAVHLLAHFIPYSCARVGTKTQMFSIQST